MIDILGKIANIVKYSYVSLVRKDEDYYQFTQVTYQKKPYDVHVIYPYGLAGNLPTNSLVVTFAVDGDPSNLAGIGNDPENRFKGLKEGEVQVGSPLYKQYIKFDKTGSIAIESKKDLKITAEESIDISSKDMSIKTSNDFSVSSENNIDLTAVETVTITGKHVIISGEESVSLGIKEFYDDLLIVTNGQTAFTLTHEPQETSDMEVFLNGVRYSDFTVVGTSFTWNEPLGISLEVGSELIAKYWRLL